MSDPKKELYRDGLTIRDHFAGRVLQALIASRRPDLASSMAREELAKHSYDMADAMLKERAQ